MKYITITLTEDQISKLIAGLRANEYTEADNGGGQYEEAHNAFSRRLADKLRKARQA